MTLTKANGIDLAWDGFGDRANETILLISGLGTQRIRWRAAYCMALAARGYRVLRFDNRDAGGSTHFSASAPPDFAALASALAAGRRPAVPYTLEDMAADAIGLLDALGVARAHVVGRSMGGMIAQILASDHPDRVLSLTSIMSSTGNPVLPQAAPEVLAMMMGPRPIPPSIRRDSSRRVSPSPAASRARPGRSTKAPIAPFCWRRRGAPMIRRGPPGRSRRWRRRGIVAPVWRRSSRRRSSFTGPMTR